LRRAYFVDSHPLTPAFVLLDQFEPVARHQRFVPYRGRVIKIAFLQSFENGETSQPVARGFPLARIEVKQIEAILADLAEVIGREPVDSNRAQRLADVAKEGYGKLSRGRPRCQDARVGVVFFEITGGLLVEANEIRIGQVVLKGEGIGRVDKPGGNEIYGRQGADGLSNFSRQLPHQRDRAQIENRKRGKEVTTQHRAPHQAVEHDVDEAESAGEKQKISGQLGLFSCGPGPSLGLAESAPDLLPDASGVLVDVRKLGQRSFGRRALADIAGLGGAREGRPAVSRAFSTFPPDSEDRSRHKYPVESGNQELIKPSRERQEEPGGSER